MSQPDEIRKIQTQGVHHITLTGADRQTSIDFWEDNRLWEFKGYPWWLRSVAGHPDTKYGKQSFLFWQYTGTGIVPGIRGDADINVFNGSAASWRKWLKANAS